MASASKKVHQLVGYAKGCSTSPFSPELGRIVLWKTTIRFNKLKKVNKNISILYILVLILSRNCKKIHTDQIFWWLDKFSSNSLRKVHKKQKREEKIYSWCSFTTHCLYNLYLIEWHTDSHFSYGVPPPLSLDVLWAYEFHHLS